MREFQLWWGLKLDQDDTWVAGVMWA